MDLALRENNPYANGYLIDLGNGDGLLLRDKLEWTGDEQDDYHTVMQEQEIDAIAEKFYAPFVPDASKWYWVITDANNIPNPLDLSEWVGKEILIPNILNVLLALGASDESTVL